MVEVARTRAARDEVDATFDVHDVSAPLRSASRMRRSEVSSRSSSYRGVGQDTPETGNQ
jgi:hypothetical protein